MPKVDLAMHFYQRDDDYFGASEYCYRGKDFDKDLAYVNVSVDVDEVTAKAIGLAKKVWGQTCPLPPAHLDGGGHGENRGIVVRRGIYKGENVRGLDDFAQYDLRVRVSFGGSRRQQEAYDLTKPGRFHIGIWAGRQFFPVDYKELGLDETAAIKEVINYSLRWVNGKFDDWSDPEGWAKGEAARMLDAKVLHESRTTYALSESRTPDEDPRSRTEDSKLVNKLIGKLIDKVGRRERAFPLCPSSSKTFEQRAWPPKEIGGVIPIVGHPAVEGILTRFGLEQGYSWESYNARKDDCKQGVNFLFGAILPAMENFAKSAG